MGEVARGRFSVGGTAPWPSWKAATVETSTPANLNSPLQKHRAARCCQFSSQGVAVCTDSPCLRKYGLAHCLLRGESISISHTGVSGRNTTVALKVKC